MDLTLEYLQLYWLVVLCIGLVMMLISILNNKHTRS
jgi:hypothetical protein